jgi:S-(hydroxymethyl)glutathione dehydrogenase/alcohol dehydrogenase
LQAPAVVLRELGRLPELVSVEVREPGAGEVLVRMAAGGICHTDVSYMRDARACPVLLGHEGAGVVEETGSGVVGLTRGDHVVINWQAKCHRCRNCRQGRPDLCEDTRGTAEPRVFLDGRPLSVMLNAGTFCPWVVVPAEGAVPIRRDMPLDMAAMLGCAVATGVGAAVHTAEVGPGDSVVVLGTGGVGLNVVQGARLANAGLIIACDRDVGRLRLALEFGADCVLGPDDGDLVQGVLDLTEGRGVDHVFEVVGVPELMLQGIDMLARGSVLTLVGAAARDDVLPFHPRRFMSRQQQIRGCIYGNIRPMVDLPLFADLYMRGSLRLDPLRAESLRLEEVPALFGRYAEISGIRPIVSFEGAS